MGELLFVQRIELLDLDALYTNVFDEGRKHAYIQKRRRERVRVDGKGEKLEIGNVPGSDSMVHHDIP